MVGAVWLAGEDLIMTRYAIITDGVVDNIVKADADFAAAQGWIEAPAHVGPGWGYDDGQWSEPVAPIPTADDVTAECDRRLKAGVIVTVTGYGDIPMQGRAQDMINTLSLKDTARDLKDANITTAIIPFRDADNTLHSLTADQVIEMVNAGKQKASLIYQTAWDMKDGTGDFTGGIPADFTADTHWP